ncbi:hypothetical protein QQ020_11725 [Fulvivirgaceae bacterium BMA12]|uniref:YdhG-like domain-containing protein n=1 Tax=Agaribacillus aureus TaxID=3051825 RepID=A0ABT8L4T0_9BACT|nr:hypothetical protein [Fulvivirgaceae bacterium BMA12]
MTTEITEIRGQLKDLLMEYSGPLRVRVDKETNFEVNGTVEAPQGKKMVQGIYFSSIVPKQKDVRFYFYPAYTHPDSFEDISEELKKFKKGKSCFHVKYLNNELEEEIRNIIGKAVAIYKSEGWLEND